MTGARPSRRRRSPATLLLLASTLAWASFSAAAVDAEPPAITEAWRWVDFTRETGLPATRVALIAEPPGGRAWAVTRAGVRWFDGFFWRPAETPPGGLGNVLAFASLGSRLVVVTDRGVFVERDVGASLQPVRPGRAPAPRFLSAARLSPSSAAVVGEEGSLWRLQGEALEPWRPAELDGASAVRVLETSTGTAWLETDRGLYRWSGARWVRRFQGATTIRVAAICEDATGGGLLAVNEPFELHGVWHWAPGGPVERLEGIPRRFVTALECASGNEAVVAYDIGHVYGRRDRRWVRLDLEVPQLANVLALRARPTGDLWVATDSGLRLFRRSARRWRIWQAHGDPELSVVNEILSARDGTMWLATGRGVVRLSASGMAGVAVFSDGLPEGGVTALGEDQRGRLWAGSGTFPGVYRFTGARWQQFPTGTALDERYVHKIRRDRAGRLWFLTLSGVPGYPSPPGEPPAVYILDGDRVHLWPESNALPGSRVYAFAEGPDGARWFGTSGGLSRWRDGSWRHWTTADGLPDNRGFALAVDREGRVWLADGYAGVSWVDGDRLRRFTTDDGLASDAVWDLAIAEDGTVWAATRGGLSCYRDGVWVAFGRESGLPNTRLWPVLPLGSEVWVGSTAGPVVLDLGDVALPTPRVEAEQVVVEPYRALVRWRVAAWWGEVAPGDIKTRVQLDGGAWSPWSTAREHRFEDLSPGTHAVVIQAANLFGRHDAGVSISFRVPPPVWRDARVLVPAAFLSAVALLLAAALVVKQRRHRALLRAHQARLGELQRLETVARLAGGVAHIFNNLLTIVMGHADLLAAQLGPEDPRRQSVGEIRAAADRAAHVVRQLLGFAERHPMTPTTVDLNALVVSVGELLRRLLGGSIDVHVELSPEPAWANVDPAHIEQVLVQLGVNAREAMPNGGRLAIRVSHVGVQVRAGAVAREPGRYVLVRVADTGTGIDPEVLPHIFEPFFSTRDGRLDTGLGLATCHGLVRQHGGWIEVDSRPGAGTTFRIYLPSVEPADRPRPEKGPAVSSPLPSPRELGAGEAGQAPHSAMG